MVVLGLLGLFKTKENGRKFVNSHKCTKDYHTDARTWFDSTDGTLNATPAYWTYRCEGVDGGIFIDDGY